MSPGHLSRRLLFTGGGAAAAAAAFSALARRSLGHVGEEHSDPGASPAVAAGTPTGTPTGDPTVRHMVDGESGVAGLYLTIANAGSTPDALLGGTTAVCGAVEPHAMRMDGDLMVMEYLPDGLPVPAGGAVTLEPDGDHVMLIGLTRDLRPNTTFTAALTFRRAGTVEVTSSVRWTLDPDDRDSLAEPVTAGDLTIDTVWSRPAPMISTASDPIAGPATPTVAH